MENENTGNLLNRLIELFPIPETSAEISKVFIYASAIYKKIVENRIKYMLAERKGNIHAEELYNKEKPSTDLYKIINADRELPPPPEIFNDLYAEYRKYYNEYKKVRGKISVTLELKRKASTDRDLAEYSADLLELEKKERELKDRCNMILGRINDIIAELKDIPELVKHLTGRLPNTVKSDIYFALHKALKDIKIP